MNGVVKRIRPGLKLVAAICLSFAILLVVHVPPASAATEPRPQGGYGDSRVFCNRSTRQIVVDAYAYQDNGGSQLLATGIELYDNSTRRWTGAFDWKYGTTLTNGNGAVVWNRHTVTAPSGSHYVKVWYAWWTVHGWQYLSENKGWCNF